MRILTKKYSKMFYVIFRNIRYCQKLWQIYGSSSFHTTYKTETFCHNQNVFVYFSLYQICITSYHVTHIKSMLTFISMLI